MEEENRVMLNDYNESNVSARIERLEYLRNEILKRCPGEIGAPVVYTVQDYVCIEFLKSLTSKLPLTFALVSQFWGTYKTSEWTPKRQADGQIYPKYPKVLNHLKASSDAAHKPTLHPS
uniref:Uncharacterized protein n=1 Tax=Glossina pallidipes TaxID=7398 RepID=A0A1A9ZPV8_GLOPL